MQVKDDAKTVAGALLQKGKSGDDEDEDALLQKAIEESLLAAAPKRQKTAYVPSDTGAE